MSDLRLALIHEKEAIERWFSAEVIRTHEENVAKHSRLAEIAAELERLSPKSPDTEIHELQKQLEFDNCCTPSEVLEITNRLKELREQKSNPEVKPPAAVPSLSDQLVFAEAAVNQAETALKKAKQKERDLAFEFDYAEHQKDNQVKQWCRQLWEAARKAEEKATEEANLRRTNARADKIPPAWFIEWVEFNDRRR